jgi:UDPglucose--hexose-1-phosphate uridylyltransferase
VPDLRKDPLLDRWVIIAPQRAGRPNEFRVASCARTAKSCPFCAGHEHDTPPALATYPEVGSAGRGVGWQVRVVPNRYAALHSESVLGRSCGGLFESLGGYGEHEVIIESPDHVVSLTDLSDEQAFLTFLCYRDRLRHWRGVPNLASGFAFKNVGPAAGASLEHTHSQLIVMPVVPLTLQSELSGSDRFFRKHRQCAFCAVIDEELERDVRIVCRTDNFVAFCPFASRFPYEMWIVPAQHASHFEEIETAWIRELAQLAVDVIGRMEAVLGRPDYNYLIHSAPFDTSAVDHYHWHIEIFPRTTTTAGFEWGTGFHINPVPPEDAVSRLRAVSQLAR